MIGADRERERHRLLPFALLADITGRSERWGQMLETWAPRPLSAEEIKEQNDWLREIAAENDRLQAQRNDS